MADPIKKPPQKPGNASAFIPGFFRRLIAITYDLLLLFAVLFVTTLLLLPLNQGEAFTAQQIYYPLLLLLISFVFYTWFWTHGGQTLGLRAWKMKVLTLDGKPISWTQATIRFFAALLSWLAFGLGFLWIFFDKDRRSWHDHLSKTALFKDVHEPHN